MPNLTAQYVKNAKGRKDRDNAKTEKQAALCKTFHGDGGGLFLKVSDSGGKSWVFKWRVKGTTKQKVMGLGSYPTISLADARDAAEDARKKVAKGTDPIQAREEEKAEKQAAEQAAENIMTFDKASEEYITSKLEKESKPGSKTVDQWRSSLKQYASPHIGGKDVDDITTQDVLEVLKPIWYKVPETASRVRMRLENILAWAAAMGHRDVDKANPAAWRGHLISLLPSKAKIAPVQHFAALDYADMPALYQELRAKESLTAKALRWTMLTAARTGETIGAEWSEIDDTITGIWTIPAERMKAGKEHLVPLSSEAGYVLSQIERKTKHVFPGGNKGSRNHGHMSNMAMLKMLREIRPGKTVHGFRSAFRDWAAEQTDYPNHVAEMALAHIVQGVEGAYRRGALLEKRAELMEDWARYLTGD